MSKTKLVQQAYGYFGQGNIPAILEMLHPNIVWESPYKDAPVKPRGTFKGKDQVLKFFQELGEHVEVQAFEPRQFVEQGDTVVALGYMKGKVRATGKVYDTDWAMIWKFEGNQVIGFKDMQDTNAAHKAFVA